jgi:hypothetical protein
VGRFSRRITINVRIPTPVSAAINSMISPYPDQYPMTGISKAGLNVSPYASIRVNSSAPKPTITNQWAAPTTVQRSIRVWPSVSVNIVPRRARLRSNRSGSGWPSRTTRRIPRTARTTRAIAPRVMTTASVAATIWTGPIGAAPYWRWNSRSCPQPTGLVTHW